MPTLRLRYPITPGRPLTVEIPPDIASGEVEVLIHLPEPADRPAKKTIAEFLDEFAQRPARRTQAQIDSDLAEERASWD